MSVHKEVFIEVKDPRGHEVICTLEWWESHILDHHPDMEGWEDEVIEAIQKPEYGIIYRAAHYPNRCVYYKVINKREIGGLYIKVIVVETESKPFKVVTAHFVSNKQPGEVMIWPGSKK